MMAGVVHEKSRHVYHVVLNAGEKLGVTEGCGTLGGFVKEFGELYEMVAEVAENRES